MTQALTIERDFHIDRKRQGRKVIGEGRRAEPDAIPEGRVPRISRLMALAIRFEGLIAAGEVVDQADIARLGHVSRARVTQIMNLLALSPDIQEEILLLPLTDRGHDPIREIVVRPIAAIPDWRKQRRFWRKLKDQSPLSQRPS